MTLKKQHEQAIGHRFVNWYNKMHHTNFSLVRQADAGEAPDLEYTGVLRIEVTAAYYDDGDAQIRWRRARRDPQAPSAWPIPRRDEGKVNAIIRHAGFDNRLVEHINQALTKKCRNDYGRACILVIDVRPPLTPVEDLDALIGDIKLPGQNPFTEIYLTGNFPGGRSSEGGYHVRRLWPRDE